MFHGGDEHRHGHHDHHHHHGELHPPHLRGLLHLAILKIVSEKPMHGGEIQRRIGERFGLNVPKAMVYGLLRRLERHGFVVSKWVTDEEGPARRIYYVTEEGLEYLSKSIERLKEVREIIDKLIS